MSRVQGGLDLAQFQLVGQPAQGNDGPQAQHRVRDIGRYGLDLSLHTCQPRLLEQLST